MTLTLASRAPDSQQLESDVCCVSWVPSTSLMPGIGGRVEICGHRPVWLFLHHTTEAAASQKHREGGSISWSDQTSLFLSLLGPVLGGG